MGFGIEWIVYAISIYIAIFIILILIKAILKHLGYIKDIPDVSAIGVGGVGTLSAILGICLACSSAIVASFGFFFFPPVISSLLIGISVFVISDLVIKQIDKHNIHFLMDNFIINLSFLVIGLTAVFLLYGGNNEDVVIAHTSPYHIHADFRMFIEGNELNFYTPENIEKDPFVHFHDGEFEQNVIHFEGKRETLGYFFNTLNFNISNFCNYYAFIVNGQILTINYGNYIPDDLDKLMISCSKEGNFTFEQLKYEYSTMTNFSCKQSKKC